MEKVQDGTDRQRAYAEELNAADYLMNLKGLPRAIRYIGRSKGLRREC